MDGRDNSMSGCDTWWPLVLAVTIAPRCSRVGTVCHRLIKGSVQPHTFDSVFVAPVHRSVAMVQLNDPFAGVMGGDWNTVMIRVINYSEGSGNFAYASVVDNATNDAFFVRGVKQMMPDE